MTEKKIVAPDLKVARFFWWCRKCGWWAEVDFSGLCSECRHDSDRRRRGATPEELEQLGACRRCRI